MESEKLQLFVEIRCKPGRVTEVEDYVQHFIERTRAESGCTDAAIYRVNEDEDCFVFVGEFVDEDALTAHFEEGWRQILVEELPELLAAPPRRMTMRRVA